MRFAALSPVHLFGSGEQVAQRVNGSVTQCEWAACASKVDVGICGAETRPYMAEPGPYTVPRPGGRQECMGSN